MAVFAVFFISIFCGEIWNLKCKDFRYLSRPPFNCILHAVIIHGLLLKWPEGYIVIPVCMTRKMNIEIGSHQNDIFWFCAVDSFKLAAVNQNIGEQLLIHPNKYNVINSYHSNEDPAPSNVVSKSYKCKSNKKKTKIAIIKTSQGIQ